MSWPDDGGPRYVVSSVGGFAIRPGAGRGSGDKAPPPVSAYVMDRAFCYRIVAAFEPAFTGRPGKPSAWNLAQAVRVCGDLNDLEEADGEGIA